jgi:hypothetical protein
MGSEAISASETVFTVTKATPQPHFRAMSIA